MPLAWYIVLFKIRLCYIFLVSLLAVQLHVNYLGKQLRLHEISLLDKKLKTPWISCFREYIYFIYLPKHYKLGRSIKSANTVPESKFSIPDFVVGKS